MGIPKNRWVGGLPEIELPLESQQSMFRRGLGHGETRNGFERAKYRNADEMRRDVFAFVLPWKRWKDARCLGHAVTTKLFVPS